MHGIIDTSDAAAAHIKVMVGTQSRTLVRDAFPLTELFQVMQESTCLLGDAFAFHPEEVTAVGHRVVHGGSKFTSSVVITPQDQRDRGLSVFAPLHNPRTLEGIRIAMQRLPGVPHVAVFDTAFHQTLPPYAYLYGLPHELCKNEGIRRYGFPWQLPPLRLAEGRRGAQAAAGRAEIVSCHLGIGASCAPSTTAAPSTPRWA